MSPLLLFPPSEPLSSRWQRGRRRPRSARPGSPPLLGPDDCEPLWKKLPSSYSKYSHSEKQKGPSGLSLSTKQKSSGPPRHCRSTRKTARDEELSCKLGDEDGARASGEINASSDRKMTCSLPHLVENDLWKDCPDERNSLLFFLDFCSNLLHSRHGWRSLRPHAWPVVFSKDGAACAGLLFRPPSPSEEHGDLSEEVVLLLPAASSPDHTRPNHKHLCRYPYSNPPSTFLLLTRSGYLILHRPGFHPPA